MPDYVESFRLLSKLSNNLNCLFMNEDNKTVTIPLSEYKRIEEIVENFHSQKEDSYESYDKVLKETDIQIEKLLGCKPDDIIHYRISHNVKGSMIEHINLLRERLEKVLNINGKLMNENYILKCEISKYESKKWYKFWKVKS